VLLAEGVVHPDLLFLLVHVCLLDEVLQHIEVANYLFPVFLIQALQHFVRFPIRLPLLWIDLNIKINLVDNPRGDHPLPDIHVLGEVLAISHGNLLEERHLVKLLHIELILVKLASVREGMRLLLVVDLYDPVNPDILQINIWVVLEEVMLQFVDVLVYVVVRASIRKEETTEVLLEAELAEGIRFKSFEEAGPTV